ncbi:2-dehydropantoate 2-reductase N-terminal domain-containing protein [Cellulomonas sp. ES6]|uniref:ketopantoate reductase family protein n=1 Tax=Cellulomonas sp. ES6 TaxID=3039384 RepID=UPI0024B7ABD1|nr:2-dehydropantoate 2-reductase N-terminal domain-containing protein [Cellulomonas sp. ES6]WHP17389.1 2-dehydropantoate 2-reductase N-terminal domain-containing protein [Cellulomonas sp. ES6]
MTSTVCPAPTDPRRRVWQGDRVRYVIIGAGAVGGTIGGLLAEAGGDVVLVARGAHLDALRSGGLHLTTPAGARTVRTAVASRPEDVELRRGDVLVLAVKSQDTDATLAGWAGRPVDGGRTAGEDLLLVCAQNGVDNERTALRRFARVAGMCVWLPATFLEPGRVSASGSPVTGVLTLGSVPAGVPDADLAEVSRDLEAAGFRAPVVEDVAAWKYAKLLSNLGNAVEALCGPVRGPARELADAAVAEAREVLAAAGLAPVDAAEEARAREGFTLVDLPGVDRRGGSTWQSLVRGAGSVEAAYLNGEIALLGRLHGVPVPVNATLLRLVEDAAARGEQPGGHDAAEVLASARAEV